MGTSSNVVSGKADVYIAPETAAIPGLTGNATDFTGGGFTALGYTDDGVEIDYTATDAEIRVDEESFPIDVLIDKESASISVKLAETTMQNISYALTGATLAGDQVTFGGLERPNIFRIGVQGKAPADPATPTLFKTRQIVFYRVYAKSAMKMHYKRNGKVMIQVQFVALADSTQPATQRAGIFKDS